MKALEQARDLFLAGIRHFEQGQLSSARDSFEQALRLAPGRPSVISNLALTRLRQGDHAGAGELFRALTECEPAELEHWRQLALCEKKLGHWAAAASALEHLLQAGAAGADWLDYAACHARAGQPDQALAAVDQALALAAHDAQAWSMRGSLLRERGDYRAAADCYRQALAHGGDAEMNGYYLASLSGQAAPAAPPSRYIAELFDDYATDFQAHLVEQLGYQGHARLLAPLLAAGRRYATAVDLGCGTGLCGQLLAPLSDSLDGVDLAPGMVEQSRALGLYRQLDCAELNVYLRQRTAPAELFVAADVFSYLGDLAESFRQVRRLLLPGGRFAFTVEQHIGSEDFVLQPSLRYRHSEAYLRRLAQASGFSVLDLQVDTLRHDQGRPIAAYYVHLG